MVRSDPMNFIGSVIEVQGESIQPHDPGQNLELLHQLTGRIASLGGVTQILRCKLWRIGRLGHGEMPAVTSVACIYARGDRGRT